MVIREAALNVTYTLVPMLLRGNAYQTYVWVRDEAEIKVPGCVEFLFVVFVATSGA